jgi:hypothetical protein
MRPALYGLLRRHDTQYDDIQHNDTQHRELICDTHDTQNHTEHNNTLPYAECSVLFIVLRNVTILSVFKLNIIMLCVVKLNVIMMSVVMLNVVAPLLGPHL